MLKCQLVFLLAACSLAHAQQRRGFFENAGQKLDQGSKVVAEKVSDGSQHTAHAVKEGSVTAASATASGTKAAAHKVGHLFKR